MPKFEDGPTSTDRGAVLLRGVDAEISLLDRVPEQFTDYRDPDLIQHSVGELVAERIIRLPPGSENLDNHDRKGFDPLLAL